MSRCYRFIINFCLVITFTCLLFTAPAYSLPTVKASTPADVFLQSGIRKLLHGNYAAAITDLTKAIALQQDLASAYSDRCLAYLNLADYHHAIADCDQALHFSPHSVEAYMNRGLAYYRLGNYDQAIADNNHVIALQPHDFRAYYNRGIAYASRGNHQQAISDYNLALMNAPQTATFRLADIYNDRGLALFESSDLTAAIRDFSTAISLNPRDYRAYYNRGCVCGRNGDKSHAISDFTASIKLNASNPQAYLNRGMAYHQLGYEQAAIADLHRAVEYFAQQGETINYERTLSFLKNLQYQLSSRVEIAVAKQGMQSLS